MAPENVYNTAEICTEGVYNTLIETLNANIVNENMFGMVPFLNQH